MLYHYYMHGLYFESDIKLYDSDIFINPECRKPDVFIRTSRHFLPEVEVAGVFNASQSDTRTWFRTEAGSFLIENGTSIFVAPSESATNILLSAYITGWCVNFVMVQRGKIGIHSTALSFKDHAFLISGISGAGKTTTAISLIERGCKYLSDDIAFTSSADNDIVYPALPMQKLCRDVAEDISDDKNLVYIDEYKDKFALIDHKNFDTVPKKLAFFFLLETGNISEIKQKTVTGFEKVTLLLESLYMSPLYRKSSFPANVQSECLKLAGSVQVIRLIRPYNKDTVDKICNTIFKTLEESCQP